MINLGDKEVEMLSDLYQHELIATELGFPVHRMSKPVGPYDESDYDTLVSLLLVIRTEIDLTIYAKESSVDSLRPLYANQIIPLFRLTNAGRDLIVSLCNPNDELKQ